MVFNENLKGRMGTDPSSARQAILSMKGAVAQRGDRAPSWSAEEMKDRASPSCGAVLAPLREAWRTVVHYAQHNENERSGRCLHRPPRYPSVSPVVPAARHRDDRETQSCTSVPSCCRPSTLGFAVSAMAEPFYSVFLSLSAGTARGMTRRRAGVHTSESF